MASDPPRRSSIEQSTAYDGTSVVALGRKHSEVRAYLIVREAGSVRVLDVADGSKVSFGRVPENTVQVDEPRVSRHHAIVRREGDDLIVEDLGSRNGTKVNGRKIIGSQVAVSGGDSVKIGSVEVAVAMFEGASAPWEKQEPDEPQTAITDAAGGVVVADPAMVEVFDLARRLAAVQTTVLVLGETGVGKEVIAEQIHRWSPRASKPFVALSCAALPETILESELFGYERGAFTGADRRKTGYFEAANGGTLLLDEIGELPANVQVKLLTVLENREVFRLGATAAESIDVRVIAATHRDLEREVAEGRFREDLYYRLSSFVLRVPPLRERRAEIALFAEMFAREIARRSGSPPPMIENDAIEALAEYAWPGNVRELRNAIEHAWVLADKGHMRKEHLPDSVRRGGRPAVSPTGSIDDHLADVERRTIEQALSAEGGNQTRAAKRLGMSRSALLHRMKKHGLR